MAGTQEEADEYHLHNASARQGKIIGRVARPQAYVGEAATQQRQKPYEGTMHVGSQASDARLEPPQVQSLSFNAKARVKAAAAQ